ncbi:hypothetical protein QOZ80_1BG0056230 [Eleusine coracana subsp. coracana]|nr:hypothetical protein QOZ80_1BG0056230 [Eleusine coracana subsp. coracana]
MELNSLGIYNLENVVLVKETGEAKLQYKSCLHTLTIHWGSEGTRNDPDNVTHVLEGLRPHSNLKELRITGHKSSTCPKWLGSDLCVRSLESLHLDGVEWKDFPPLGELLLLKQLKLENVHTMSEFSVKICGHITTESFSKLKRIELIGLKELIEWKVLFSATEELVIINCPKLKELQNLYWLRNLQLLEIKDCPNILSLPPIPWTVKMCYVDIRKVGSTLDLSYEKDSLSKVEMSIDREVGCIDEKMLAFDNLNELQDLFIKGSNLILAHQKHLSMLTSLNQLYLYKTGDVLFSSWDSQDDVKWQLRVRNLVLDQCNASGKDLTRFLYHLLELSYLSIFACNKITRVSVILEDQKLTTTAITVSSGCGTNFEDAQLQQRCQQEEKKEEEIIEELEQEGLLLFPPHLCGSIQDLNIVACSGLSLVRQGGGLQNLRSLLTLSIINCPLFYAYTTFPSCPFPSSLKELRIEGSMGMEAMGSQGEKGLWWHLLAQCHHITNLEVKYYPKFFASWETSWEQNEKHCICKLEELKTDDTAGLFTVPVCSLLSASLTKCLNDDVVETFSDDQENALQLLTSLKLLQFRCCNLGVLPNGLVKLTKLEEIYLEYCKTLVWWPEQELPSSLQILDVRESANEMLEEDCRTHLQRIIPKLLI